MPRSTLIFPKADEVGALQRRGAPRDRARERYHSKRRQKLNECARIVKPSAKLAERYDADRHCLPRCAPICRVRADLSMDQLILNSIRKLVSSSSIARSTPPRPGASPFEGFHGVEQIAGCQCWSLRKHAR